VIVDGAEKTEQISERGPRSARDWVTEEREKRLFPRGRHGSAKKKSRLGETHHEKGKKEGLTSLLGRRKETSWRKYQVKKKPIQIRYFKDTATSKYKAIETNQRTKRDKREGDHKERKTF